MSLKDSGCGCRQIPTIRYDAHMPLKRILEPEVMDSADEAHDYDTMDHSEVNRRFVEDCIAFLNECQQASDPNSDRTSACRQILDLGTGTAQIPVLLSEALPSDHTILAADMSLEMLRVAQRNIRDAGCDSSVVPICCNARQLPVPDRSCHYLISNSIIHHIPEPAHAFAEICRVAAPGAVFFLRDLLRPDSEQQLEELVARWAGNAIPHQQQMFRESLYAALTVEEVRDLLRNQNLDPDWVRQTTDRHWTIAGQIAGSC